MIVLAFRVSDDVPQTHGLAYRRTVYRRSNWVSADTDRYLLQSSGVELAAK